MDERVYEIAVCSRCLTQVRDDVAECGNCGSFDGTIVRFRVARSSVLKQAAPRESLIERTLYFGCVREAGHYYWRRSRDGYPYKLDRRSEDGRTATPWGYSVDGKLLDRNLRLTNGSAHIVHKDGWTALAFVDDSVDSRPGSWSVFCIPEILDGPEALVVARAAFPSIFARYEFEVRLAP